MSNKLLLIFTSSEFFKKPVYLIVRKVKKDPKIVIIKEGTEEDREHFLDLASSLQKEYTKWISSQ